MNQYEIKLVNKTSIASQLVEADTFTIQGKEYTFMARRDDKWVVVFLVPRKQVIYIKKIDKTPQ